MASTIDLSHPDRPIQVGVILLGGMTELVDIAVVDAFHLVLKELIDGYPDMIVPAELKAQAKRFEFHWVSEHGPSVQSQISCSLSVTPTDSFETAPVLDIIIMGARNLTYQPNEKELAYIRKTYEECTAFISVCGGVVDCATAGILDGVTATAPRRTLGMLDQTFPKVNWVEKRWVRDGKMWSSGALLNGMDLITSFAKHYWGHGEGTLTSFMFDVGGFPDRDVDYKDTDRVAA